MILLSFKRHPSVIGYERAGDMDETVVYHFIYASLTLAAAAGLAKCDFHLCISVALLRPGRQLRAFPTFLCSRLVTDLSRSTALKRPPYGITLPWLGDSLAFIRDPFGFQRRRHKQFGEVYRYYYTCSRKRSSQSKPQQTTGRLWPVLTMLHAYRFTLLGETYVQVGHSHSVKKLLGSDGKLVEGISPICGVMNELESVPSAASLPSLRVFADNLKWCLQA